MLVSSAKNKHSEFPMQNQLLDKSIFSVRYLEIRLCTIFFQFFEKAGSIEIDL